MSLNWDVTKVENYSENFPDVVNGEDRQWNPTTMALVWAAIPCAWGWAITEANYREIFVRLHMYEHTRGAMRSQTGPDGKAEEVFFTLKEVQGHIGMSVNVSEESKTKFGSKLVKMIRQDAETELRNQEKAMKELSLSSVA